VRAPTTVACLSVTQKGIISDRPDKPNQDRALVLDNALEGVSVYGAFDGHGEFGHLVSEFVIGELPRALLRHAHLLTGNTPPSQVSLGIDAAIQDMNRVLEAQPPPDAINCVFSGSTAVFALHRGKQLFVVNVGDSRAILCRAREEAGAEAFDVVPLSTDHKPDRDCERERILAAGGRVETLPGSPGDDNGPARIWLMEADVPGLALSRVVAGDLCARGIGVTTIPEVLTHDLIPRDTFALFASDGVWEFLTNEQVAALLWTHRHNPAQAIHHIIAESTRQWNIHEEGCVVDDITVVLVQFVPIVD
jgi:serine/threonine protein phosphatase PrpC